MWRLLKVRANDLSGYMVLPRDPPKSIFWHMHIHVHTCIQMQRHIISLALGSIHGGPCWIQDFCAKTPRKSWILDPYNVRIEIFKSELFPDLRFSSQRNWGKPKNKKWTSDQGILWFFLFLLFLFFPDVLLQCASTTFKSSRGSARYCTLLNLAGHHPGVHFLLMFSEFEHPLRKLLKTMGRNTRQPRLENIISKQVSAWTSSLLSKQNSPR